MLKNSTLIATISILKDGVPVASIKLLTYTSEHDLNYRIVPYAIEEYSTLSSKDALTATDVADALHDLKRFFTKMIIPVNATLLFENRTRGAHAPNPFQIDDHDENPYQIDLFDGGF